MRDVSKRSLLIAAASFALARPLGAQERVTRLVFPFGAGGASDGILRRIAEQLRGSLDRPVIVENRVGAGGRIGAVSVKEAAPNGETILVATGAQMSLQPHAFTNLGYEPLRDFRPVSQIMTFAQGLAVGAQVPVRTLKELALWIGEKPDRAVFGSPGVGTGAHFAGMTLGRQIGVELRHAAYRSTPAALPDLATGRLPFFIASAPEMAELHRAGTIRLLGVFEPERSPSLPDVATAREGGFDILAPGSFAAHLPAKTPEPVVQELSRALIEAVHSPSVEALIRSHGYVPTGTNGETLARLQRDESTYWAAIVKATGFQAEL